MPPAPQNLVDPDDVEQFLRLVVEHGTILAAGTAMGISRATVYRRVKTDRDLGMRVAVAQEIWRKNKYGDIEPPPPKPPKKPKKEKPPPKPKPTRPPPPKHGPVTWALTPTVDVDVEVIPAPLMTAQGVADLMGVDAEAVAAADAAMPQCSGRDVDISDLPPLTASNFLRVLWRDIHTTGTPTPIAVKARDLFQKTFERAIERQQARIDAQEQVGVATSGGALVIMEVPANPARSHLGQRGEASGE